MPNSNETHAPRPAAPANDGDTIKSGARPEPGDLVRVKGAPADVYEIRREIARGGMGVVYAASDRAFDREVAIKVMLPGMDADLFLREARITARLQHPGIPPVHALGALADGRPFLVMKLIRGDTLKALLAQRTDPTEQRTRLLVAFAQMCETVGYAHAQGIVHRDLKPANVMVGAFGEVQVMDWGIGKETWSAEPADAPGSSSAPRGSNYQATAAGEIKGTPAYMAPEQARGEPVDARADVFALGGILAAILTGQPPFAGTSAYDTIVRAAGADLADAFARLDASGADAELVALCKRCLAASAADRFADGRALTDAVAAYRAGVAARLHKAERDRAAAEVRAGEELKRQADLKAARADALLDELLMASDASAVPRLVADLNEFADLTGPKLRARAAEPVGTRAGLHARLALLASEPTRAAELAAHVPQCAPEELPVLAQFLKSHAGAVAPALWAVLEDERAGGAKRARAAGALAALAPEDERWAALAPAVADAATRATPAEFVALLAALEPVRARLVPVLLTLYSDRRREIESGKLDVPHLVGAATAFDRAANLLARYADRLEHHAELALLADARHFDLFAPALRARRAALVPELEAELAKPVPSAADAPDAALETWGKRRGHAAALLVALGEAARAWPLFAFPADRDPTARGYLLARLAAVGAGPGALVARYEAEADVSARRALLLALGDFPPEAVPGAERAALTARLLVQYREHPDPGLHGAIDWLLRRKWGAARELAAVRAELAREGGAAASGKNWFVNREGQTFAVVRGPVEFTIGSPLSEPGHPEANAPPYAKRIARTFAVATTEVTADQFLRFRPEHDWIRRYSPGSDTPVVTVTWYDCAAYCNWLSEREGIPCDQWCYEPNAEGTRFNPGHLERTGYRLPTEAEWEFACRGGAVTARYYGRGEELLARYAWFNKTSDDHAHPVGQLRPNELGLFDALGNVWEWCEDRTRVDTTRREDVGGANDPLVDERWSRVLRGGAFSNLPVAVRAAYRNVVMRPGNRYFANGFRPVRTLR